MMNDGCIMVWGDLRTRRHWENSLKVVAKARPFAEKSRRSLEMVLIGAPDGWNGDPSLDLASCVGMKEAAAQGVANGVQRVCCITHPELAVPRTDLVAGVLSEEVHRHRPWLVLFPLNDFGRETAAICAQKCNAGLIADCTELVEMDGRVIGRCPAWGGEILADITLSPAWQTAFITVAPHGAKPETAATPSGTIETRSLTEVKRSSGIELKSRTDRPAESRKLELANKVVVGGAGVGDIRGFGQVRELAAALGAEVGATRPPVMSRWVAEDRLIGQTGHTVRPRLLISVGTSGAIQYTAGISEADTVVAINTDKNAPIFQWADIGIVADAGTIIPLLAQRLVQLNMKRLADAACSLNAEDAPETAPDGAGFGELVTLLRQARDWRREDLAEKTGQTPDFIRQVEAGQLSPPVSFILGMAQAMQVDPGTFLGKEEQTAIRDRRAQAYYQRTREYSYTTLTPGAEESHLRAFMVTIQAKQDHKPVAYKHDGEEFIYVLEGALELTLGTQVQVLEPGESVRFNSDVAHKLKSVSHRETRCLVVLYTL